MEFKVKEFMPAVIKVNYEEVQAYVNEQLQDYKNLVVTEETLPACKVAAKN